LERKILQASRHGTVAAFARDHEGLALSGSLEHASIIGKSKSKSPVRRAPAFRRRATVKCSNGESGILLLQLEQYAGRTDTGIDRIEREQQSPSAKKPKTASSALVP
jgi:hypothetical protein